MVAGKRFCVRCRKMQHRFQLALRRRRLVFRNPVNTAHGPWRERDCLQVRVSLESGAMGYAEAAPLPWSAELIEEDHALLQALVGMREESEPWTLLPERACSARGALRRAFHEAMGESLPLRHPHLPVAALLPSGPASLAKARGYLEAGHRCLKWKVGVLDASDEFGVLDDLCALLPNGARLRLDANGAWNRRQAERWLQRCAERPVEFVEQPVDAKARGAEDLLRGLASDFPVAIALDESVSTDDELLAWQSNGWQGLLVVKPTLLDDSAATLGKLYSLGARLVFSSALETRIGARQALRAAFSWPGEVLALGFGVWPLFEQIEHNGPSCAPFLRREDLDTINVEESWNAQN